MLPPSKKAKKGNRGKSAKSKRAKKEVAPIKLAEAAPSMTRSQDLLSSGDQGNAPLSPRRSQDRVGSAEEGNAPLSPRPSQDRFSSGEQGNAPLSPRRSQDRFSSGEQGNAPPSPRRSQDRVDSGDQGKGQAAGRDKAVKESETEQETRQQEKASSKEAEARPQQAKPARGQRVAVKPIKPLPEDLSSRQPKQSDSNDAASFSVRFSCRSSAVKLFAQLAFSVFFYSNLSTAREIFSRQAPANSQVDIGTCIDSRVIEETVFIEGLSRDHSMKEICESGDKEKIVDYFVSVSIGLCSMNWDTPWIRVNSSSFNLPEEIAKTMEGRNSNNVKRGRSEETWKAPECVIFQFGEPQNIDRYLPEQLECPETINRRFVLPRYQLKWALGGEQAYIANGTSLYRLSSSLKPELFSQELISKVSYCCYVAVS